MGQGNKKGQQSVRNWDDGVVVLYLYVQPLGSAL